MNRYLPILGVAMLALAACERGGQTEDPIAAQTPDANPASTIATPEDETSVPDYVMMAAINDMLEIRSSEIAARRSTNADVKAFAQLMADGHASTTADLKAALAASGLAVQPPATLPPEMQRKLDDLNSAAAEDFGRAYMDMQIEAHQAALDLHSRYARDGDNPQLKAFAGTAAPIVQQHLDRAREIRDALGT